MTIHPNTDVPRPTALSKRPSLAKPATLLALSALIAVGYVTFMHTPSSGPTPVPETIGQRGTVAIAPIGETTPN